MTSTQERIARFVAASHVLQQPGSPYFAADGGISIAKVAENLVLQQAAVLSDAQALAAAGDMELTTRPTGPGLRATTQLLTVTLPALDVAAAQAAAAAAAAAYVPGNRAAALAVKDSTASDGMLWRALCLILLDEFNALRQWDASFKAEVALATTLADLKTRVATLPATPNRTIAQFKTAMTTKINAGDAD